MTPVHFQLDPYARLSLTPIIKAQKPSETSLFEALNEAYQSAKTVCQTYRLLGLLFASGKMADFSREVVLILPRNMRAADLVRQKDNGLVEAIEPDLLDDAGEIKGLAYVLTAWNAEHKAEATFRHEIEHQLLLKQGSVGLKPGVNLFQPAVLNSVLRTKLFPGVKSLKFIC